MKYFSKALLGLGIMACAAAPAVAADAYAPDAPVSTSGLYLRGDAGWSWLNTENEETSGMLLGGGVGYQFNDNLRTDLRGDWAGIGSNDASLSSVLGNVYFDIPTDTLFTPYLGAGVGYGWSTSDGDDTNGFAFGLMAGLEVNLTDNLSADVGYRYRQILSEDVYANEALVGLRYSF